MGKKILGQKEALLNDSLLFLMISSNVGNIYLLNLFPPFPGGECLFCSLNNLDVPYMFHYFVPFRYTQVSLKNNCDVCIHYIYWTFPI